MRPCAPTPEVAFGSNPDSALATAFTSAGGTPASFAAWVIIESYGDGIPSDAVAPAAGVFALVEIWPSSTEPNDCAAVVAGGGAGVSAAIWAWIALTRASASET